MALVPFVLALHQLALYLLTNHREHLHNVHVFLSARLHELNTIRICQFLALGGRNLPLCLSAVTLVGNNNFGYVFRLCLVDLPYPVGDIVKSAPISD